MPDPVTAIVGSTVASVGASVIAQARSNQLPKARQVPRNMPLF